MLITLYHIHPCTAVSSYIDINEIFPDTLLKISKQLTVPALLIYITGSTSLSMNSTLSKILGLNVPVTPTETPFSLLT